MAKKKRRKKRSKTPRRQKAEALPPMPDRRAMERIMADISRLLSKHEFESTDEANAFLQQMLNSGGVPSMEPRTPLERAQYLMYDAWEASGRKRVELARRALEISPDCADAYALLAEETARSPEEARDLYEKGVTVGERALGPQVFEEDVGHFWGILSTRPYMRARAGLAQCLWALSERDTAVEHYRDMLRLNPNDNQSIRYLLAACLMEMGRDKELARLLKQYKEDCSAAWLYTRALLTFRRKGDCPEARARLREARRQNQYVPAYLLGRKRLPQSLPAYIGFGDENEAIDYTAQFFNGWLRTPGALDWLVTVESKGGKSRAGHRTRA